MEDLGKKRFFVTGGSRGLGLDICRALLNLNAQVVTCARSRTSDMDALANQFGSAFSFFQADLSQEESIPSLMDQSGLVTAPYDGFVANAATGADGLLTMMPKSKIRQSLDINLYSVILITQAFLKGLLASQSKGSLVFISSVCAHHGFKGLSVYSATKAGLCGFSKSIAREYGKRGIRSNVVLPGFLETDMTQNLQTSQTDSIRRRTPLNRLGQSADVIQAVLHLLSDASRFTTGSEITIDGGLTG